MIKISISKAAKMLDIPRKNIQKDIFDGILDTHEGLVTLDSINRAYPNKILDLDSQRKIDKAEEIKKNAVSKIYNTKIIEKENEKHLKDKIRDLNKQIYLLKKENNMLKAIIDEKQYN